MMRGDTSAFVGWEAWREKDAAPHGAPGRTPEPVVFEGHAGALHRPAATLDRGVTVVICAPIGREARWAYRPLWRLAEQLADRGFSVLRYDHRATGDSLDLELHEDQWACWLRGVEQAVAFARAHTAPRSLVLCGLRMGASLAAAAAARAAPDGLMLLAPVASGRAWIRELQMTAGIFRTQAPPELRDEVIADALKLSPAAVEAIRAFDLKSCGPLTAPTLLASPTPAGRLAASLGATVELLGFEGYEALLRDAHVNALPDALFAAVTRWLEALPVPQTPRPACAPLAEAVLQTDRWIERPVSFGGGLRGVLCLPRRAPSRQGVIFGNSGGDPRAGIGAFSARACRALAARGVPALRFDFAGLGESPTVAWPSQVYCFDGHGVPAQGAPQAWRSHVYESSRQQDFAAARAVMEAEGCQTVLLAGVCSGAYQAVRTAVEDEGYAGVLAINPARWVWRRGETLDVGHEKAQRTGRLDLHALVSASAWRRVILGHVSLDEVAEMLFRRLSRLVGLREPSLQARELQAGLARFAARGGALHVLVGREDAALDELEHYFGANGRWLAKLRGASVTIAPGLDHGLFLPESQAVALGKLVRFADAGLAPRNRARLAGQRRRRRREALARWSPAAGARRLKARLTHALTDAAAGLTAKP
jgi:alpha/beta superfamily hydrolase